MSDRPLDVSVVMPVLNGAATVASAVLSVLAQDYTGSLELIIAEGGSGDGTVALLTTLAADHPRLRIVSNKRRTTPAGLNTAIAASRGDIIVRCDAHSWLPADYVSRAVATLVETESDVVGGIQVPDGETVLQRAIAAAARSRLGSGGARYRTGRYSGPTDTVYLGVFRRSVLDRVGGFDERLLRNQDYELNYRIRKTGGVVWLDSELRVTYRPRRTLGGLWGQYYDYGTWKRRMLRLNPASTRVRQLAAPAFVLSLVASGGAVATGYVAAGSVIPAVYCVMTFAAAVVGAIRGRDAAALLSPAALATMHVGWGVGFLVGRTSRQTK